MSLCFCFPHRAWGRIFDPFISVFGPQKSAFLPVVCVPGSSSASLAVRRPDVATGLGFRLAVLATAWEAGRWGRGGDFFKDASWCNFLVFFPLICIMEMSNNYIIGTRMMSPRVHHPVRDHQLATSAYAPAPLPDPPQVRSQREFTSASSAAVAGSKTRGLSLKA